MDSELIQIKRMASRLLSEIESLEYTKSFETNDNVNFYEEVEKFEKQLISSALLRTNGHQSRAASMLGLNPKTLNAKIKHYEIDYEKLFLKPRKQHLQNSNSEEVLSAEKVRQICL